MKNKLFSLILLASVALVGCDKEEKREYDTYKDFITTISAADDSARTIVFFTQSNCPHCKAINLYLDDYKKAHEDITILEITLDKDDDKYFDDKYLGRSTGNTDTDALKKLDNRISLYVNDTTCPTGSDKLLNEIVGGTTYIYMTTPIIIWYEGSYEVQISNNMEHFLEKDKNGTYTYESFENFLEYPDEIYNWTYLFDLTYIENRKRDED